MTALDNPKREGAPVTSTSAPGDVTPIIALKDIVKIYSNGEMTVQVLHGVSLDIYPGEMVAIMGASGSGKTTLMNILGCLDRPTSGSYLFAGQEVAGLDADQRALLRRSAFGFIFQQYNLLAAASATENVEVPAVYAGLSHAERLARAEQLLSALGLGERLDHRPSQLSGGQQQRVAIARSLVNDPLLILADEPTGALDSRTSIEIMAIFQQLNRERGITVVLVTHEPDISRFAQRILTFKDGQLVGDVPVIEPQDAVRELGMLSSGGVA
jgi:macrolide transport system ATP-binding/permease protein